MNPFLIKAVLFDFDGVLFDSEPVRFRAGAQALAELGVTLTWDDFTRCWLGRTDDAGLRDILGARFEADGPRVIARRNVLYEERLDEVQPFTDAGRFLRRIPEGTRLAIATGSRRLEVEGILWRAVMTQSCSGVASTKPWPMPLISVSP